MTKALTALIAFLAANAHCASVTLQWGASSDPGIGEYTIRFGTNSGAYPNSVSSGMALVKTVSGLAAGRGYYFVAMGKNTNGLETPFSNEVFYLVPPTTNDAPPFIGFISDVTNSLVTSVNFTVGDTDTDAEFLFLSADSSDINLVPNENIAFIGTGTNRVMMVSPAPRQIGSTIISVTVSDGSSTVIRSFSMTVRNPLSPGNLQIIASSGTNVPMRFDGASSTMDFGDVDPLGGITNGMVIMWMFMGANSDPYGGIVSDIDDSGEFGWGITLGPTNNLHILSRAGSMASADTGGIPTNTWVHVAINLSRDPKCWINGAEISLVVSGAFPIAPALNTAPLSLGSFRDQYYFKGQLANVAIYTESVSVSAIQAAARDLTHRTVPPGYYVLYP